MQRLVSLFSDVEEEPGLAREAGPPPDPPGPDYNREPEYFRNLLDYLRVRRSAGEAAAPAESGEQRPRRQGAQA